MPGFTVDGFGVAPKAIVMKDVGTFYCSNYQCRCQRTFQLNKLEMKASLLYIKTATLYNKYGIYCEKCGCGYEINEDKYNRILSGNLTVKNIDGGIEYSTDGITQAAQIEQPYNSGIPSEQIERSAVQPPKTKQCAKCQALLDDDADFCTECGAKYETQPSVPVKRCRHCGKELEPGTKFCIYCGKRSMLMYCPRCGGDMKDGKCIDCGFVSM